MGVVKAPAQMHLRDGAIVHVRPVEGGDRELIRRGFERLGPESC